MTLVLDASLTLSWFFEDAQSEAGDAVLNMVAERGAFVPGLWRLEVANGLFVAMRRKRLDAAYRDKALAQLARLPITVDGKNGCVRLVWRAAFVGSVSIDGVRCSLSRACAPAACAAGSAR